MYYYILEPDSKGNEHTLRRATNLVNLHGITGEMATPSSSQPLEDLLTRAAEKGYNTIVAVGGDRFISTVASYLTRSDIAFGAIPISASEAMHDLLGVKNLDHAVLSLKQRRLSDIGVGVIAPGKVFLLDAEVQAEKSTPIVVETKLLRAEGSFTSLTIERQEMAAVRFSDSSHGLSGIQRFASWLVGRRISDSTETVLRAPILTLTTPAPLPIMVDGREFAKTPCKVRVVPNALKLIQARATISTDKE